MASSSLIPCPLSLSSSTHQHSGSSLDPLRKIFIFRPHLNRTPFLRLQASRRSSNFSLEAEKLVDDHRNWNSRSGVIFGDYDDGDEENEDDDADEDRSLDLLVRFVQNVFKKVSRKARKAVRSVLPIAISSQLVRFSVDGVIILAFLWVLKAFLQVVCTLGSVVFVSILFIRGIWTAIFYLQESHNHRINELDDDHHVWTSTQPAS